ncbi:MAG: fused response regulator/phosphatase [Thermoanaerobaculia bacterium]
MKDLSDCRVLIVDDVRSNVQLLAEALKGDYRISVALDGESALKAVEASQPDIVLLDIVMPGIDGYEVLRRLRGEASTRELPVMFLSSLEDVADKAKGFELGANDYLTKPFEVLEVKARVRSLLKAKAYSDAVKAALERDLSIAKEIQLGLLPSELESCAEGSGLDLHAVLEPAQHVGGDLYLALRTAPDRLFLAVGDVSGKGIPASLFMAVTMTLLRSLAREHAAPEVVLARLNEELAATNRGQLFVTLICTVFDLASGKVHVANAGHPSPVLLSADGVATTPFPSTGLIAGLFPVAKYTSHSADFAPGDTLVFYSDGVSEAMDPEENEFGEEKLVAGLLSRPRGSVKEIVDGVFADVRRHAAGAPQSDDITVVAVRRRLA